MDRGARFWDRWAQRYSRTPIKDEATYERKLELTREYLRPEHSVLEVGCGTGGTAVRHAPYVAQMLATDFSGNMIAIARERAAVAGLENLRFEKWTLEELAVQAEHFDAVLALSVLHLLDDRDAAVRCVHDLLKPGGIFVSSTACLGEHFGFMKVLGPVGRALGLLPTLRVFTMDELRSSIERAGFDVEEYWVPEAKKPHVVFIVARRRDPA